MYVYVPSCHRELESWVHDMQTLIASVEMAKDVASAEETLQRHRERKVHWLAELVGFSMRQLIDVHVHVVM